MAATPVIIGIADVKNKSSEHKEPAALMTEAIHMALQDSGAAIRQLTSQIDSIDVVRTWTWPYADLPGLLSDRLGLDTKPKWARYTDHGGNQPAKLVDEAAARIARGVTKVAVVTGGEALASLYVTTKDADNARLSMNPVTACAKAGNPEPREWTKPETPVRDVFSPTTAELGKDIGGTHSIGAPMQIYPLYENAFRAFRGQTPQQNNDESSRLYAQFAGVAAENPYSWNYGKPPAGKQEIGTVSRRNRMICLPYPLLMNAFNTVNLAAACILTSVENARDLGVPEHKWVYPLAGSGRKEKERFWERPNFYHSEAVSVALDECLAFSKLKIEDIDAFDLYSCFPIVPKLACHHLGLSITSPSKPLTLLGGLTSFGGAGNNYSMHAITEMSRQIRSGKIKNGLVLANGGWLSYQHVICLSSGPKLDQSQYHDSRPSSGVVVGGATPPIDAFVEGEAIVETYTVEFSRDGQPETAFIVGRVKSSGHRFIANHGDQKTLQQMASVLEEQVGKQGHVLIVRTETGEPERNAFYLGPNPNL